MGVLHLGGFWEGVGRALGGRWEGGEGCSWVWESDL